MEKPFSDLGKPLVKQRKPLLSIQIISEKNQTSVRTYGAHVFRKYWPDRSEQLGSKPFFLFDLPMPKSKCHSVIKVHSTHAHSLFVGL